MTFNEIKEFTDKHIFAALEQDMTIINWEVQGGRRNIFVWDTLPPLTKKELLKYHPKPHQATNEAASSSKPLSQATYVLCFVGFPRETNGVA